MERRKLPKKVEKEPLRFWTDWHHVMDVFRLHDMMYDCDTCKTVGQCHEYMEQIFKDRNAPTAREIWGSLEYIRKSRNDNSGEFLTKYQAAEDFGVSSNTMRRWCRRGFIKTTRRGFSDLISVEEWERFKKHGNRRSYQIERRQLWDG